MTPALVLALLVGGLPDAGAASTCIAVPAAKVCVDALPFTYARFADFLNRKTEPKLGAWYDAVDTSTKLRRTGAHWAVAAGYAQYPAVLITWAGAQAACADTGARLCTNAEFAAACSGPKHLMYPYGTAYDATACNGFEAGVGKAEPVGARPQCLCGYAGLFDMAGNVWQWVDECKGDYCYAKGGSWGSFYSFLTCSYGDRFPRDLGATNIGFRCCRGT